MIVILVYITYWMKINTRDKVTKNNGELDSLKTLHLDYVFGMELIRTNNVIIPKKKKRVNNKLKK